MIMLMMMWYLCVSVWLDICYFVVLLTVRLINTNMLHTRTCDYRNNNSVDNLFGERDCKESFKLKIRRISLFSESVSLAVIVTVFC